MINPELMCLLMILAVACILLTGFPVAFVFGGTALIFAMLSYFFSNTDISILYAYPQRVFGSIINNEVLVAIPLFIFMGIMLEKSNIAQELLEAVGRLFGKIPGGLTVATIIVGMLLAATTGIVGATVITMGVLSLPTMLRYNYNPSLATGTICASGTLGQIIPPSIVLVMLGDQMSTAYQTAQLKQGIFSPDTVSVNDLFAGAILPGLLLVVIYLVYVTTRSLLRPQDSPALPKEEHQNNGNKFYEILKVIIAPIALILAVLGSILFGLASPTEASGIGAISAILLAASKLDPQKKWIVNIGILSFLAMLLLAANFDLRISINKISTTNILAISIAIILFLITCFCIITSLLVIYQNKDENNKRVLHTVSINTMYLSAMVFMIIAGASMFSLVFRELGGADYLENTLSNLPGSTTTAIILVMITIFILGFFLDFIEIIFIIIPIVAPILLTMKMPDGSAMSPIWLSIIIAMNLQTSFLTPPFGFSLFYLREVAPKNIKTLDIYKGVVPFIAFQILAILIVCYFPQIATWLPTVFYDK